MYDSIILVCTLIMTVSALITLFPLFGFSFARGSMADSNAPAKMTTKHLREKKLWAALILTAMSVLLSTYSVYLHIESFSTLAQTDKFAWRAIPGPTHQLIGKHFQNEKVLLDDNYFINCTFKNVTLVFNGTAPFRIEGGEVNGYTLTSENPAMQVLVGLLYSLHGLTMPVVDLNTQSPPDSFQPAKPIVKASP